MEPMTNRLANASSPYLRQHAGNPVDWQPWGAPALDHARASDTPILLSIGYSACHWCHVMAHECFEDPMIAAAMNASFVNIKMDREERPDIDHAYQLAYQALNGRGGGWPLTAFLDPQDLSPFFVGTYFPPVPRHGLPGFSEVLRRVRVHFDTHRRELRAQAERLRAWMRHAQTDTADSVPNVSVVAAKAMQGIATRFDPRRGGNTGAPKFPRSTELEWLLDLRTSDESARHMAHLTLANMAARGLQDHLGGGFFRYCVDANWTIPHFEKMLYDNAQLLPAYARAAVADDADTALRDIARSAVHGIVDWLARDMTAPDGAFYSSLDADSEHEEGRFYLWTRDQVRAALDDAGFVLAEAAYGLDMPANFEGRAWHLLRDKSPDAMADKFESTPASITARIETIRERLFEVRAKRVAPTRDDKILTAWNALAISGLARTARLLDDTRCAAMAMRALAALRRSAWIDGRLFANVAEPASRIPGFLDDHAFLLDALLETVQLAFDPDDLAWAIALANALIDEFVDRDTGGFRFSTPEHATPLAHSRGWTDDALPNGSAVAVRALLRLGHLIGDTRYVDHAQHALRLAAGALDRHPDACPTLLRALIEFEHPRLQIVVRCSGDQTEIWQAAARESLRGPGLMPGGDPVDVFVIASQSDALPGLLAKRTIHGNSGTAYVCTGTACREPVTSPEALAEALRNAISGHAAC
jgi:uncharacterized protein YyaL (SSP411 family)